MKEDLKRVFATLLESLGLVTHKAHHQRAELFKALNCYKISFSH